MRARGGWGALLVLAVVLVACDTEEAHRLDVIQAELDTQLVTRQALVNRWQPVANRRAELVRLVAERAKANLGSDPQVALNRALPVATNITVQGPGPSFLVTGSGRTRDLLAQLKQLAQSQPGLIFNRLAITPSGFAAQISLPPPVAPMPQAEPSPPWQSPPLPPEPFFESSRARKLRERIRLTISEVTQLDKVVIPLESAQGLVVHDEKVVRDASVGDRLHFALESAEVFFAGERPWFTVGELDLRGNDVDFSAPDLGSGGAPPQVAELLKVRFAEPHIERANGRIVMHLTRQPIDVPGASPAGTAHPTR